MGSDMLRTFTGLTNAWDNTITDSFALSETDIDVRMLTNVPPSANSSHAPVVITNTGNLALENFAEWDIIPGSGVTGNDGKFCETHDCSYYFNKVSSVFFRGEETKY